MTKQPADLEALFAREIRRAIAVDGRSINAVGQAAGFSRSYLSQLLRGRQDLKVQHVERVLEALEFDPGAFFGQVRTAWLEQRSTPAGSGPSEMDSAQPEDVTTARGTPDEFRATARTEEEPVGEPADLREMLRAIMRQELPRVLRDELTSAGSSGPLPNQAEDEQKASLSDELVHLRRRLRMTEQEFQGELEQARSEVREVKKLQPEERTAVIERELSKYRSSPFGVLVLEEARRAIPEDPAESLSLAEAALASCEKARTGGPDPQVRAPALAVKGNALRALGRLTEADQHLEEAARVFDSSNLDDALVLAEIDRYLGSLRRDQVRLEEARSHMARAGLLYRAIRRVDLAAVCYINLGLAYYHAHEHDAAVSSAEKALDLLGPEPETWLAGYAHYNLALFLHGRGESDRAAEELAAHQAVIETAGEKLVFRAGWLRGRIAWSREELAAADRHFRQAISWARGHGLYFEAGLISLERALVHLVRGRTDRVRKLAREALALFAREEEVERETRAALEVLEAAARRDALTRKALEQAVATLDAARHRRPVVESPAE